MFPKKQLFFTLALGALALLPLRLWAAGCGEVLRASADQASYSGYGYTKKPSVTYVDRRPGRHGGQQIRIRRITREWGSSYTLYVLAAQGDPRDFINVFGKETAAFFGFEMISDKEMWIPDASEFNGALSAVKARLVAKGLSVPPAQFYPQGEASPLWYRDYLFEFGWKDALPIGDENPGTQEHLLHLIHDLSFHSVGALLLDPEAIRWAADQSKVHVDFVDFLLSSYNSLPPDEKKDVTHEQLNTLAKLILLEQVSWVDVGTANLGVHVHEYFLSRDESQWRRGLEREYKSLLRHDVNFTVDGEFKSWGYLPEIRTLNMTISRLEGDIQPEGYLFRYLKQTVDPTSIGAQQLAFAIKMIDAYKASDRILKLQVSRDRDPDLILLGEEKLSELCSETMQRRTLIMQAAQELWKETPGSAEIRLVDLPQYVPPEKRPRLQRWKDAVREFFKN